MTPATASPTPDSTPSPQTAVTQPSIDRRQRPTISAAGPVIAPPAPPAAESTTGPATVPPSPATAIATPPPRTSGGTRGSAGQPQPGAARGGTGRRIKWESNSTAAAD